MDHLTERIINLSPEKRALLEQRLLKKQASDKSREQICRRDIFSPCPLSFAQQRLWFLDQLEPGTAVYNIPRAIHFRGPLNVLALEQSFNEIVRRHEILRTTFTVVDGEPVQVVAPASNSTLSMIDLQALGEREREAEVERLTVEEAQRPFDLAQGPLLRTTLLKLGQQEHVLLLTMHHIISDGWSTNVLYRELSALYEAFSSGHPSPLQELTIQYADFSIWQRKWLSENVLESQLDYWLKQLDGAPAILNLPVDRPRPPVQGFQGAQLSLTLSKTLTENLKRLSQEAGCTLFMTLLAAFQTLLYRHTGQGDIVVGSPIANRNRAEIEDLIGFFVNTLVLRTELSGSLTFRELLVRVREVALGAYAHQDFPFEKLVEELHPKRDVSHPPLFQVMFNVDNNPGQTLALSGLAVSPLKSYSETTKFDLNLSMVEEAEGLRGTLTYNPELFDRSTIERILGHFQVLLAGIIANPDTPISQLQILTEAERHQLLVSWNETKLDYPHDQCVHQLIEAQVDHSPDAIAIIFEDDQLSYQALNRRANQLAHYLRKQGIRPGMLVGICVERSLDMVIGLLGILKAGGAYVPLDPGLPKARLSYLLKDTRASLILTQERFIEDLPEYDGKLLCLDRDYAAFQGESEANPTLITMSKDLAYVIYTSGSTGQPKGVLTNHQNVVNHLDFVIHNYNLTPADTILQIPSFSFDGSVRDIFGPLMAGAKVIMVNNAEAKDPAALLKKIEGKGVTAILTIVPTLLSHLLEIASPEKLPFHPLRLLLASGESLPLADCQKVQQVFGCRIVNQYGPTECTLTSTHYPITDFNDDRRIALIGRPNPNTQVYLLDNYLNPVPIGVTGEIYIGGTGVAQGYLNRPELTAELFIPNPFDNNAGSRLYKTGDLGRYLPDGNIEFLGRLDHQVKIRGFRIELGEIEKTLEQYPEVKAVVTSAREDKEKRLVAYVVPQSSQAPTVSDLRHFLREKLPDYMLPSTFIFLKTLPLTANGKVNRQALPAPEGTRPELAGSFVAPRTTIEKKLVSIWAEVLKLKQIGIHDNFFDLGGHSLLAVRLFTQIEQAFNKKLPLTTLFQAPTVAQLAEIMTQANWAADWSPLVEIQHGAGSSPPFFCVHGWGGGVMDYAELARLVGPEQPFYGLQARGLNGKEEPHTQITEMARDYLNAMRSVQPVGPYYLGGYCQGGVIAFEMARQLQTIGERVALLAIFEAYAPIKRSAWDLAQQPRYFINFAGNLFYWLIDYWQLGYNGMLARLRRKTKSIWHRLVSPTGTTEQIKLEHLLDDVSYIPQDRRKLLEIHAQLRRTYRPQPYHDRVTLFRVRGLSLFRSYDPEMGWGKLTTEGVEIKMIAGSHYNILEQPHVQLLAQQLESSLNQARKMVK